MRTIGALVFPGFELLDLFGPMEMFGLLPDDYEITLVSEKAGNVVSGQKISTVATAAFKSHSEFDILFVPGGVGTRKEIQNDLVLDWISRAASKAEYTLSVCTGSALLAKAGVIDGKHATTNKSAFSWVETQGPEVLWEKQARWVEDGNIFTSSGISAGMDMALAAIARMHGQEHADMVALWCEYEWQKDSTRDPFAEKYNLA